MNYIADAFEQCGYEATRHRMYLKPEVSGQLSYWGSASSDGNGVLITLGAIAPKVNKFALGLLKKVSEGRIRPQFPAYVVPPVFITHSVTVPTSSAPDEIKNLVDDFTHRFGTYSIEDWFGMAATLMPYAPAQSIILPAYFYLKRDREALLEYLSKSHLANPTEDVAVYLDKLHDMASEMEVDTITTR